MTDVLRNLSPTPVNERGMSGTGVAIWRRGDHGDNMRTVSVGKFLSMLENQSGDWLIDGGWGGPPGPIRVRWRPADSCWINLGFPPWEDSK